MQSVLTTMTARCRNWKLGSIAPTHLEKIPAHNRTARSQSPGDLTGPDRATVSNPCARLQFHAVEFPCTAAVPRVENVQAQRIASLSGSFTARFRPAGHEALTRRT